MRNLVLGVIALSLVACATPGAGTTQNPCGLAQVQEAAPAGLTQQQQQALKGGQDVSSQPNMQDPAKWSPGTTWGGGAGAVEAENAWDERRAFATGSTVAQGVLFPQTQEQHQKAAQACMGVPHPQLLSLDRQIASTEERLALALSRGDSDQADKERKHLAELNVKYETASSSTAKTVNIHYDFAEAMITQGVSSGATADGKPGAATTTEDGTAVTPSQIVKSAGAVPAELESPRDPPVEDEGDPE